MRCMLNLGLQGVGVMREATSSYEGALKGVSGLAGIRKLAESKPEVKDEILKCVEKPRESLESVFQKLDIK